MMEIRFTRSGGFAGRATEVTGVLHFTSSGAHVSIDGTDYKHSLSPKEATQLKEMADAGIIKPHRTPPANQMRDGYQYHAVIVTDGGKQQTLMLDADEQAASKASPSARLRDWIEQETQKIWEFRLAHRPK